MKRIYLLIGFFGAAFAFSASAAGVQVLPSKIEVIIPAHETRTYTITVANPTRDVQTFEVYPNALEDQIMVSPRSFNLEAGERREVTLTIKPTADARDSQSATTISIVAKAIASGNVKAGTGVKLPITIIVGPAGTSNQFDVQWWWVLPVLAAAVIIFWYVRQRKREVLTSPVNPS